MGTDRQKRQTDRERGYIMTCDNKILALRLVSVLFLTVAIAMTGGESLFAWLIFGFVIGLLIAHVFDHS